MQISGFSFVRNAIRFDYPIVEAVKSVLPLVDEFVIAVGKSDDDTMGLIRSINDSRIKIVETVWDDSLREGGRVLAVETDKAFRAVSPESDWAFYIQGDEVLHEKYHDNVRAAMKRYKDDRQVDGLLFNYRHFYGSYDYIGAAPGWYRKEIRVVRNSRDIWSYRDAQGFRKGQNSKLNVKQIEAFIYHYGWVKDPRSMQRKQESFHKLWHTDEWMEKNVPRAEEFDYSNIDALELFRETHPAVMQERINRINWKFDHDISRRSLKLKDRFRMWVEEKTGYRIGEYKNYRII
jgi:hypothetical protein